MFISYMLHVFPGTMLSPVLYPYAMNSLKFEFLKNMSGTQEKNIKPPRKMETTIEGRRTWEGEICQCVIENSNSHIFEREN